MIIAGLQKLSLVDYPGSIVAVVFTQGCNFRCGYCQNPELVTFDSKINFSEEELFEFLELRKKVLDGVVITGGEPAIHKDLPSLVKKIKAIGLAVKLDTNGAEPDRLEALIKEGLLDYVAIDIKTSLKKYGLVTDMPEASELVLKSIKLVMASAIPYEFRTTCVPGILEEKDLHAIGEMVKGAKKYVLQQFRPQITYKREFSEIKPYTAQELRHFGEALKEYVEKVEVRGV